MQYDLEPVYTADELAARLKFHPSYIRRIFKDEPGVLKVGNPAIPERAGRKGKREYYCIRIPQSVAVRVLGEMTVRGTNNGNRGNAA